MRKKYITTILIFIISILIFHISYGIQILNPSNIKWLLEARHDWGQHYLGWAFFRNEEWNFPLGNINNWYYPMGTNIGLTDSIPLFAIFFKLFNPILSNDFQYIGLYIFLSYFLIGYYTNKLLDVFNISNLFKIITIIFILSNPVLAYRGMHPALCGQWLIIASLFLYFKKPENIRESYKIAIYQGILIIISGFIHPYLSLIIAGFALIIPFKNYIIYYKTNIIKNILILTSTFLLLIINWYIVGIIGSSDSEVSDSYGLYSWNLNSFFNSGGYSSFFNNLPQYNIQQYEGYSYLGLGIIILIPITIILLFRSKYKLSKNQLIVISILFIWCIPLSLFGISNVITYNDSYLFTYPIPNTITKIGNIFRATSRFIWLIYYILLLFPLIIFSKININKYSKYIIILSILIIQLYDIKPLLTIRNLNSGQYNPPLNEAVWSDILKNFSHIITYPIYSTTTINDKDYQDFAYLASKNKISITNAYVARSNFTEETKFNDRINQQIANNLIDINTIYITSADNLDNFLPLIENKKITLKSLDGYILIYSSDKEINIEQSEKDKEFINNSIKKLKPLYFKKSDEILNDSNNIKYNLEQINIYNDLIKVSGWAFIDTKRQNSNDSTYIVIKSNNNFYISPTKSNNREDLVDAFANKNIINAGFYGSLFTKNISFEYPLELGLAIKNNGKFNYITIDNNFSINPDIITIPKQIKNINLSKNNIIYNIENIDFDYDTNYYTILGWAAFNNLDNNNTTKNIILEKDNIYYIVETVSFKRPDVVQAKKELINIDNSGFKTTINIANMKKGSYRIGIKIINKQNQYFIEMSDKTLDIK